MCDKHNARLQPPRQLIISVCLNCEDIDSELSHLSTAIMGQFKLLPKLYAIINRSTCGRRRLCEELRCRMLLIITRQIHGNSFTTINVKVNNQYDSLRYNSHWSCHYSHLGNTHGPHRLLTFCMKPW